MELCRLCHLEILSNSHKNLLFDKTGNLEILDVIVALTGLKINENDPFPKLICCDCYGKLISFYNFRELVIQADQRYHQELMIDKAPFEIVDIKKELNEIDRDSTNEEEEQVFISDKAKRRNTKKQNGLLKKLLEDGDNSNGNNEANLPLLCEIKIEKDLTDAENNQQLKAEIDDDDDDDDESVKNETPDNDHGNELKKCSQCGTITTEQHCSDCERKLNDQDLFKGEISKENRKCNQCNKVFVSLCNLKRHISTVHSGVRLYLCNICGQSFAVNDTLQRHLKTHSDEKTYQCNYCGKCFLAKGYLRKHLNVHTPANLFACHICDRTFKQKSYLNVHLNVHFDNKRYNCNICNKQFSHKSNLNTHMRVHNGEKRFECDYCGKRFLVKCNLKKHLEVHNK